MVAKLSRVMEWYEIALDSQKVMKKLIKRKPEIIPLDSILATKEVKETNALLQRSIGELNDLTIVSLVSIFEQVLIEHLKIKIQDQFRKQDAFSNKLCLFTIQQVERGRFTEIIDLYKPYVGNELIGIVKQIYTYRNWVAHGKRTNKILPIIDPVSAYERLSSFLYLINKAEVS